MGVIIIIIIIIIINTLFIVGSNSSIKANKSQGTKKIFQIPMLNRITQIVNGFIFVKSSISNIWLSSECTSDIYRYTVQVQEIFLVLL